MDLSKLQLDLGPRTRETDPIRIFGGLTQRGSVETLYGPQQEALTTWHQKHRTKADVLFSMSTGGGKTLVGLLTSQSLVNELRGKVLYLCPTNQLVEQTAAQAKDCGIAVATYASQTWTNRDRFDACDAVCVTNYFAAFRGGSPFFDDRIAAVLFDDAHVAPSTIRSCFTMSVDAKHPAWPHLIALFAKHFDSTPFASRFAACHSIGEYKDAGSLLVPAWFIWEHRATIAQLLTDNGIDARESLDTRFAYEHLRDHLASCAYFVGTRRIEITPPVLPTHSLPYFANSVRRVYLTATLPSRYECIRTFGADRAEVITPTGKIGAAQRLIVFPQGSDTENAYDQTRWLIRDHKACVIVPSKRAAERWTDLGAIYDSKGGGHGAITAFAASTGNEKLILAGLFDGIDLPGRACKILVLDGLPRGTTLHDKFVEDGLDSRHFRLSQLAGRLTQAVGRIFRSNTDHGVVILADKVLQSWLRDPAHLAYLPVMLQQQLVLGEALRRKLEEGEREKAYPDLMRKVVEGAAEWDAFYNAQLSQIEAEKRHREPEWGDRSARREFDAWRHLWNGRYKEAATGLEGLALELTPHDPGLAAWHMHWSGLAHAHDGEDDAAIAAFNQAANTRLVLGRPPADDAAAAAQTGMTVSNQVRRASSRLEPKPGLAEDVLSRLKGEAGLNAENHEQALCDLGTALGFIADRPEKVNSDRKGPDARWHMPESRRVLGVEAKTGKQPPILYRKRDIEQALGSREWIAQTHPGNALDIWIVGDFAPVVAPATPSTDLKIVPMTSFIDIATRLCSAARRAAARRGGSSYEAALQQAFTILGLLAPAVLDGVEYRYARDLQDDSVEDGE